jgi:hypothetical protein
VPPWHPGLPSLRGASLAAQLAGLPLVSLALPLFALLVPFLFRNLDELLQGFLEVLTKDTPASVRRLKGKKKARAAATP